MSRTPFTASRPRRGGTFRPQLEVLEHRLAPGSLSGAMGPSPDPDLAFLAGIAAGQSQAPTITTSPVFDFVSLSAFAAGLPPGPVAPGSSTLIRTDHGVTLHLSTSGLQPGAYTFWWVVINPG